MEMETSDIRRKIAGSLFIGLRFRLDVPGKTVYSKDTPDI